MKEGRERREGGEGKEWEGIEEGILSQ